MIANVLIVLIFLLNCSLVWAEPPEINNKGCRDCHRFSSKETKLKQGPDLFYTGDKFHRNWLEKFLESPIVIRKVIYAPGSEYPEGKPEASQPHLALTKSESARISDFLMTLRLPGLEKDKIDEEPLSKDKRVRLKILFERNFGCTSCHETLNLVGKVRGGISGPSLVDAGKRLKPDWIFNWLRTPTKFLSKGRMPVFNFYEETVILITKYILTIRTKK